MLRAALVAALLPELGLAGCGGDEFANTPRAPERLELGAAIAPHGVTVSPSRFGAGPVVLLVSNQTPTAQRARLRSQGGATVLDQTTGPIAPGGTASLTADLDSGIYSVSASSSRIESARIVATSMRKSAQDTLLAP